MLIFESDFNFSNNSLLSTEAMNRQEIDQALVMADYYFKNNNLELSKPILLDILNSEPSHSKANELLSYVYAHEGNDEAAHQLLLAACNQIDCSPDALYYLGSSFLERREYQASIDHLERSLQKAGDFFEALHDIGAAQACLGYKDAALKSFTKALSLRHDSFELNFNIARLHDDFRNLDLAVSYYNKAIELNPDYAEAWSNKGVTLKELKKMDAALACYDRAIELKPNYAEAWSNKGVLLESLSQYSNAIVCYDRAIQLKPDYAEAWSNKGNALTELNRFDDALDCYNKTIALKPDYAEAWSNKGVLLESLNQDSGAIDCYDRAIELKPNYAEAWSNKGILLGKLKHHGEALECHKQTLLLKPTHHYSLGNLLTAKMHICDWSEFEFLLQNLFKNIFHDPEVIGSFQALSLTDDEAIHFEAAKNWANKYCALENPLAAIAILPRSKKIKIGYFTSDFCNHPVAHLIAELFELHDKNFFELIAFSFKPAPNDLMQVRLKNAFDQFIDVQHLSDREVAQLSRDLKIDIAVDLLGFTANARPRIFAYRAAPLQVNYLGYPGTMGAEYIDYIIADPTLIPIESQEHYSEKIACLPNCYQINDRKRIISDRQFSRRELDLPENGFVFCCFNNNYKILPPVFDGWMRILKSVEGSVLWLLEDTPQASENLQKEAALRSIPHERLIFAKRMPMPEHLARHRHADLFLDTSPYNAHTTASDALWSGLPVLTLSGKSFSSRVASSLLKAINLPELITSTQAEYETLAIVLANDAVQLKALKEKLAVNRLSTPLFDSSLFRGHIEAAYRKMIELQDGGLKPSHFYIEG